MAIQTALAGIAYVTVDGVTIMLVGDATYKLAGGKREVLVGMDGPHGYKETPDAGYIKFTARNTGTLNVSTLNDATDSTVVLELVNTKVIVGRNMWRNGELLEVKADDATIEIEFAGLDVTEQTSAS